MLDRVTGNRSCGISAPFQVDANRLLTVDAKETQTDFYREMNVEISVNDLLSKTHSVGIVHYVLSNLFNFL